VIVVDASAMLEVVLGTPAASRVEARLSSAGDTLHAPHLIDIEIAQVVRRYALAGSIDHARGWLALEQLRSLALTRYPHGNLLPRIWELRGNLTAYDAAYVALAEALDAPLVTRDHRLAASPGHSARIELV
jgi:predicted nucleic acid-binding protein